MVSDADTESSPSPPDGRPEDAARTEASSSNRNIPLDRFNAFSDGVFAIAITLLVLELPTPRAADKLFPALVHEWPAFVAYVTSFAFIGGIWIAHSRMTKLMRASDSLTYGTNLLLLLLVSLLPFTTSLMLAHLMQREDIPLAVSLYGFNVLLASVTLNLMLVHVAHTPGLVVDDEADDIIKATYRERWIPIALNVVALIASLFAPVVAVGLYLVQAIVLLVMPLVGVAPPVTDG